MNKNARIANTLKSIIAGYQTLVQILEEKDHVQSGPLPKGTVMIPVTNPNFPKVALSSVSNLSEGDERTAAINKAADLAVANRRTQLERGDVTPANPSEMASLSSSNLLKEIGRNSTTVFFKRTNGFHRGSVLSQDRKSGAITDHKYLVSKGLDEQLCLVSKDQDGLDYVKNYVRPSIKMRVEKYNKNRKDTISDQIVRYYRPQSVSQYNWKKGPLDDKPKTHSAVYLKDRLYIG